jgi:hypothetical protein
MTFPAQFRASAAAIRKLPHSPHVSRKNANQGSVSQLPHLGSKQQAQKKSHQIRGMDFVAGIS